MNPFQPQFREFLIGLVWMAAVQSSVLVLATAILQFGTTSATNRARLWQWCAAAIFALVAGSGCVPHLYVFYSGTGEPLPFPFLRAPGDRVLPTRLLQHFGLSAYSAESILLVCWLLGVGYFLIALVLHWRGAIRLVRSGTPLGATEAEKLLKGIADRYQERRTEIRLSPAVPLAACWWLRHPVIVMSSRLRSHPPRLLRAILLHELAHLRYNHSLTNVALFTLRCCLWFNPLIHLADRSFRLWAERACDEFAVNHGYSPREYARLLLSALLAYTDQLQKTESPYGLASTFYCSRNQRELKGRIDWVLNYEPGEQPPRRASATALVALTFVTLACTVLRIDLHRLSFTDGRSAWTPWPPPAAAIASTAGIVLRDYPLDAFLYDRLDGAHAAGAYRHATEADH